MIPTDFKKCCINSVFRVANLRLTQISLPTSALLLSLHIPLKHLQSYQWPSGITTCNLFPSLLPCVSQVTMWILWQTLLLENASGHSLLVFFLPLYSHLILLVPTSLALSLELHISFKAFPAPPIASAAPSTKTFKFMFPEKNYCWISESHFQLLIRHFPWWHLK